MFASQTRGLSHIELERSNNISSLGAAKAYRVNEVDISTEEKTRARIEGFYPFILALSACIGGVGLVHSAFVQVNAMLAFNGVFKILR